jgi:hypothetical protein
MGLRYGVAIGFSGNQFPRSYLASSGVIFFTTTLTRLGRCFAMEGAVARAVGITFRNPLYVKFPDLWERVSEEYQRRREFELPKKTEMFQLHNLRCDVQHWGLTPFSSEVVNRYDLYVADFVTQVMQDIFGIDFKELFMSSLIENATLRKILATAEKEDSLLSLMRFNNRLEQVLGVRA